MLGHGSEPCSKSTEAILCSQGFSSASTHSLTFLVMVFLATPTQGVAQVLQCVFTIIVITFLLQL